CRPRSGSGVLPEPRVRRTRRARGSRAPDRDVSRRSARRRGLFARNRHRRLAPGTRTRGVAAAEHRGAAGHAHRDARLPLGCVAARPNQRRAGVARRAGAVDWHSSQGAGGVMLRTNLSTRPFYNERAVHVVLALIGGLVLALTLVNINKVIGLSKH